MNTNQKDALWPHFFPLWIDLKEAAPKTILAGGYGLFLKQKWLLSKVISLKSNSGDKLVTPSGDNLISGYEIRTLVDIQNWLYQEPRVTGDLDFIMDISLIASQENQMRIHEILKRQCFTVKTPRWQFKKKISKDQFVVVDFLAPKPDSKKKNISFDRTRVKHTPSLNNKGIHGRTNEEAIGCDLYPFNFEIRNVTVSVPNPVTWIIMKLIAMNDRLKDSQDQEKPIERKNIQRLQSEKHALDAFRAVAMTTREENNHISEIIDNLRETPPFIKTSKIIKKFFTNKDNSENLTVRPHWKNEDFSIIRETLITWFC
jgi:hypothetical protein